MTANNVAIGVIKINVEITINAIIKFKQKVKKNFIEPTTFSLMLVIFAMASLEFT